MMNKESKSSMRDDLNAAYVTSEQMEGPRGRKMRKMHVKMKPKQHAKMLKKAS